MLRWIVCLFVMHDYLLYDSGNWWYQKGVREIVYGNGRVYKCRRCGRERYFPNKKENLYIGI